MRMSQYKSLAIFLLFAGMLICRPAVSQQNCPPGTNCPPEQKEQKEKYSLQPTTVVVTATRTEQDESDAPGSLSVVTAKDLEIRSVQTVDQAIDNLPGVFQGRGGLMDINPEITLRGIPGGKRALFLMDGITLNHPQYGTLLGFGAIEPEVISSVEVAKGPFSSLYGGTAMAGVVNIITKMPQKREFILKSGYGSSWTRGQATDDLRKVYVSYGDRFKDKLSIFLSYGRKDTNGYPNILNVQYTQPAVGITGWTPTTDSMGNPQYLIGDKGDTRWWDDSITVKTEYDISKASKINFTFFRTRFKQHYDEPHTFMKDATGNPVWSYDGIPEATFFGFQDFHQQANTYKLGYETKIKRFTTQLSLYYVDIGEGHELPSGYTTRTGGAGIWWDHPINDRLKADLLFSAPLSSRHLLTFGGSFEHNSGRSVEYLLSNWVDHSTVTGINSLKEGKDRTYAFFVQDEVKLLENLTAYVGFRQDWWKTYNGHVFQADSSTDERYKENSVASFSPKAALVYKPIDGTTLRVSFGKAFRPSTVYEMYSRWVSPIGLTVAGNPYLKPETATSWDIGAEQVIRKSTTLKATYFENYMSDFIYRAMLSPLYFENRNAGKAKSRGVELEAEHAVEDWLKVFANFTYTNSAVTKNTANPAIVGKELTVNPDKLFNAGVNITKGAFSASLIGRYVGKSYGYDDNSDRINGVQGSCDPYFAANMNLSYDIAKYYRLSFSIDNLFNKKHFYTTDNALDYKDAGRSWFAEFRLKL
jgi:iron complex outermembrane recepter protein